MKKYNCTISEKNHNDFISVFQVQANNLKEAKSFARMQKTKYFQTISVHLTK